MVVPACICVSVCMRACVRLCVLSQQVCGCRSAEDSVPAVECVLYHRRTAPGQPPAVLPGRDEGKHKPLLRSLLAPPPQVQATPRPMVGGALVQDLSGPGGGGSHQGGGGGPLGCRGNGRQAGSPVTTTTAA